MKPFAILLTALTLAAPAAAGGVMIDLPNLTWPDAGGVTMTKGCDHVTTSPAPACQPRG